MSVLTEIRAILYALKKEDGGRHTPLFSGYRPAFYFGDRQTDGAIAIIDKERLMPGEYAEISARLLHPEDVGDFLKAGVPFEIREGPMIVGRGVVISVHPPSPDKQA